MLIKTMWIKILQHKMHKLNFYKITYCLFDFVPFCLRGLHVWFKCLKTMNTTVYFNLCIFFKAIYSLKASFYPPPKKFKSCLYKSWNTSGLCWQQWPKEALRRWSVLETTGKYYFYWTEFNFCLIETIYKCPGIKKYEKKVWKHTKPSQKFTDY